MKTCLLTGASGGIGSAIKEALEADGIEVIGISSTDKTMMIADLRYQVYDVCQKFEELYGCPDIIINCAGILADRLIENTTEEMIMDSFQVNVLAPIRIMKYFIPKMKDRLSGHIINIGSSSAYEAASKRSIYAATKHALLGFTRAIQDEVWDYGIRVSILSPASVDTRMHKDTPFYDRRTLVTPKEMADSVMFLLKMDGPGIIQELRLWRFDRKN